jgi:predicted kinase
MGRVIGRRLCLVGGAPRVGKSTLARRLLHAEGIPWLPTDIIRTALRRVLPDLEALDAIIQPPTVMHSIESAAPEHDLGIDLDL